ncbi:MAG TPA: DUF6152 family protein [Xanthobacteraceae bacterium]|jgi:hypothetical protein
MKAKLLALAGIIVAVPMTPVKAHHAFARFDSDREVTLRGTVKEFQWTSPHAWILLTVDREGRPEQWAIEMSASSGLAREGWQPRTLTPGMAVTATIRPLRDGTNGGQFLGVTLPDGTVLGRAAAPSK